MSTGKGDGSWTPSDYRGGSGDVRDSYKIPQGEESQARYEEQLDNEAHGMKPSMVERLKRWFSARF